MLLTRSQVRTQNISVISTQKWEGLGATGHGCSVVVYRTPTEFDRNPTNVSSSLHPQPFMHLHPLFIYFLLPTTQGFTATDMCFFMYSILDFFFYIHQGFQVFLSGFTFVYLWDSLSLITRIILHILMTDLAATTFFLYTQTLLLCILKVIIQCKPIKMECSSMQKIHTCVCCMF